jgi:hypothetical protein
MSEAVRAKFAPAPRPPVLAAGLDAVAQVLDFDPGLYTVEVVSPGITRAREGLVLPCIHLDPIAPSQRGGGRAQVLCWPEATLLCPGTEPVQLRVTGGKASVLVTVYKVGGSTAKAELRVRLVQPPQGIPQSAPETTALPSKKLTVHAHIDRVGDVAVAGGHWAGQPGSGTMLEGFSIVAGEDLGADDLEYQGVLGADWNTPWMHGGALCGSRATGLPLLGLRVRLAGKAARRLTCSYSASFVGRGEIGPMSDGAVCTADGAAMEAIRVAVTVRWREPTSAQKLGRE